MAVVVIAGLAVLYALLLLVGIGVAKAAGCGDRQSGRTWLDEAPVVVRERRRAPAQPWTGAERRRPGRVALS